MTVSEIWMLPVEDRPRAFAQRWEELDQQTGNRTPAERDEMAVIADAIMSSLLEAVRAAYWHLDDFGWDGPEDVRSEVNKKHKSLEHVVELLSPFCNVKGKP